MKILLSVMTLTIALTGTVSAISLFKVKSIEESNYRLQKTLFSFIKTYTTKPKFSIKEKPGETQIGLASWYGGNSDGFAGRKTANGEIFNPEEYTAASKTLPLGSYAKVLNLQNGKEIIVRINDRGPYVEGRILDLSKKSAEDLGITDKGVAEIKLIPVIVGIVVSPKLQSS